ncbi:hypothetical protein [Burkholderia sp. SRS-W-2-2016]|uniref:hypothetical protein n=1 Tax=Burkholderia sp. SRS-W-2-2016 TaxID=1926878 RepID=UPI000A60035E|nr:hypothetical protein [Burkholderia sp. SRS-W-2-2016]
MPTSSEIQAQIERMESDLEPAKAELDRLYSEFGRQLPPTVEKWMQSSVRRAIEAHATKINAGGVEPVRQIKADLNALIQALPQICQNALGDQDQWPHRRPPTSRAASVPGVGESHAGASFRRAINHLAPLLDKHGLIAESADRYPEWERTGPGKYRYAINPGFDDRDFPVLVQYKAKQRDLSNQTTALAQKRRELEAARARELWDEA